MNATEFMKHAAAYKTPVAVAYSVDYEGGGWNVFHDRIAKTSQPCVTRVYTVIGSDRSKPHTVVLSLGMDKASGEESFTAWCGDSYHEGRLKPAEKSDRQAEAEAHMEDLNPSCDKSLLRAKLDQGYGMIRHKSAACNFWAKKDEGGCKHVRMVLAKVNDALMEEMREEWCQVVGGGVVPAATAPTVNRMKALCDCAFVAPVLVVGPPASGKTHSVRAMAEAMGSTYIEYGCHAGTETSDMLGFTVPYAGSWVWKDGPVTEAFRKAARGERVILLLDELLRVPNEHRSALLSAFGEYKSTFTLRTGRIISAEDGVGQEETLRCSTKNLHLIATTNAGAKYGVDEMDGALRSRFKIMYFGTSADTIDEALSESLAAKGWSAADNKWAKAKLLALIAKSDQAVKSAALASGLDLRAIKRIVAGAASKADLPGLSLSESMQCAAMGKDGSPIEEQAAFFAAMVGKVFS